MAYTYSDENINMIDDNWNICSEEDLKKWFMHMSKDEHDTCEIAGVEEMFYPKYMQRPYPSWHSLLSKPVRLLYNNMNNTPEQQERLHILTKTYQGILICGTNNQSARAIAIKAMNAKELRCCGY